LNTLQTLLLSLEQFDVTLSSSFTTQCQSAQGMLISDISISTR